MGWLVKNDQILLRNNVIADSVGRYLATRHRKDITVPRNLLTSESIQYSTERYAVTYPQRESGPERLTVNNPMDKSVQRENFGHLGFSWPCDFPQ